MKSGDYSSNKQMIMVDNRKTKSNETNEYANCCGCPLGHKNLCLVIKIPTQMEKKKCPW